MLHVKTLKYGSNIMWHNLRCTSANHESTSC